MAWKPSAADVAFYNETGYLIVPGLFEDQELQRLDGAILRCAKNPNCLSTDRKSRYPQPSKYTISQEGLLDPDLAFIAEHPLIVDGAEALLGQQARLSAFVSYLRTPKDRGSAADYQGSSQTAHCDYKPFRPAGSSLNWLFAILALVDYTPEIGPLRVSPGSHKCSHRTNEGRVQHVKRARADEIPPLVDANLKRGDLLFMNMFTWHEAPPNRSNQDRWGVYNKYMAADAPPGCGPFLFADSAYERLGPRGKQLLEHHSARPVDSARLILEHEEHVLLVRSADPADPARGKWTLPGGTAQQMDVVSDWDVGNVIGSLEQQIDRQLGIEFDWMTYVSDCARPDTLCRVYARPVAQPPKMKLRDKLQTRWVSESELSNGQVGDLLTGFEPDAVRDWLSDGKLRGIGMSQQRAGLKKK